MPPSPLGLAIVFAVLVAPPGTAASLPDPTAPGPHPVGHTRAAFTRPGTLVASDRRLDTVIWYPADVRGEAEDALGYVDPAVRRGRHPVLVYSHGGCAYPEASSFLTRALASWGFVVVAPTHPGDTISDGFDVCDLVELRAPTLVERVADVRWILDQIAHGGRTPGSPFFRRVARSRIGVLGWSSGASTAVVAGREDRRIRAVLSLAPDVRPERIGTAPLRVPTMVMEGELDFYDPSQTALDQLYALLRPPRFAVELQRTGHFAFSDICVRLVGGQDCREGSLSQDEAHRLVLRFAAPFLLRYVAQDKSWDRLLRPRAPAMAGAELTAEPRRPARNQDRR